MREHIWQTMMGLLLLVIVGAVSWEAGSLSAPVLGPAASKDQFLVAVDAGHGGRDPGKVGAEGQLEKDINLSIALKLREYLEAADVRVVLTRDSDAALYEEDDANKKAADMRKRCQLINEAKPDVTVSIHQNSYHEEAVWGGQAFYYSGSAKGERLAQILQRRFDYVMGEGNGRKAKANDNYYLLLHVKSPIVIVECGFLSNPQEARRLADETYQDRLAWTIHMGVMEFLNGEKEGGD